jgi:hypothetical protein
VSIGRALSRALAILGQAAAVLLALALIVYAIPIAVVVALTTLPEATRAWGPFATVGLMLLAMVVLNAVVVAAVHRRLREEQARIGESLRLACMRLPAIAGTAILQWLGIWGVLVGGVAGAIFPVVGIGLLTLAILAAVWLYARWSLASVTVVLERRAGTDALRRSAALLHGSTLKVAPVLGVVFGGQFMIRRVADALFDPGGLASATLTSGAQILLHTLQAVFLTVLYHDIRETREGVGLDELARVFE